VVNPNTFLLWPEEMKIILNIKQGVLQMADIASGLQLIRMSQLVVCKIMHP
jgi:hypothetical protein